VEVLVNYRRWKVSFNREQLREAVDKVLTYLDPDIPYSEEARELVLLTISTESNGGEFIRQVRGPARGIVQMEPASEADLLKDIKTKGGGLAKKISDLIGNNPVEIPPMMFNMAYAIAMCRAYYWLWVRDKMPEVKWEDFEDPKSHEILTRPSREGALALATYWKKFYNTPLGKGVPEEAVKKYFRFGF
jgi:hypothetical protein